MTQLVAAGRSPCPDITIFVIPANEARIALPAGAEYAAQL